MNYLPYTPLRPYTDKEWEKIPHIILVSNEDRDPTFLDCEGQFDNEAWFDEQLSFPDGPNNKYFGEVGN